MECNGMGGERRRREATRTFFEKSFFGCATRKHSQNPIQISWKRETAADEAAPEDERPDAPAAPHMYMDAHGANVGNGRASSIFHAMVE